MGLDLSREALELLRKISNSITGEFSKIVIDRTVKFEVNGLTMNDPTSSSSTTDWEQAKNQLLANEFIEELHNGIFKVTKAGIEYESIHLK
jgi:hypothetical protein